MKFQLLLSIIQILFLLSGARAVGNAQAIIIDSSRKTVDFSGSFNGSEVHLPAVKKLPGFPGGTKAWQDFLRSNINIKVPFINKAIPGNYKVMIRFTVASDGKLHMIGADSNCGYGMESEVIRCIMKCADWIPAETTSGKKVTFMVRTIVIFSVKHNDVLISFL